MQILKLIMLERKIVIYSHQASIVSSFILSLCSLIPGLIAFGGTQFNSNKIKSYLKSQEMYGFPLQVYSNKIFLIPFFTLSDLDVLKGLDGYTIGITNSIIFELPQVKADAYINIDERTFVLNNKLLEADIRSTGYEQGIIRNIVKSVESRIKKKSEVINWSCIESKDRKSVV